MKNLEYQEYREKCLKGPRMTYLLQDFEQIAQGMSQFPKQPIRADFNFLSQDNALVAYHERFQKNLGCFFHHYCASVPFSLEELCRLGLAICKLAKKISNDRSNIFTYYTPSEADATPARTIADYSHGLIRTLTDSPNLANKKEFDRLCNPEYSKFYHGCFVDITLEYIATRTGWELYQHGFDFIYVPATFQFYNNDRIEQIKYLKKLLKKDGIALFLEKLKQPDIEEYKKREEIKDKHFKSLYFSDEEIKVKDSKFLKQGLEKGQVDFDTAVSAIKKHFEFVYLIWNSTNFYEFAASNNKSVLDKFISLLSVPYVPSLFCFEENMVRSL